MEYRDLGQTGLKVSALSLGGNTFGPPRLDESATARVIHAAQDKGINFVDTALLYGEGKSESFVGAALSDGRRDKWVVATKFHLMRLEGKRPQARIIEHCETSLEKLQTDYIDLFQVHFHSDEIAEDEILRTLEELRRAGKIREIGACNYVSWQVAENVFTARALGLAPYKTVQGHYNLLRRQHEAELLPFCAKYGIAVIPYFPLGGGFLTGKYKRDEPPPPGSRGAEGSGVIKMTSTDRNWEILPRLEDFAAERGHTLGELAIAWLLANPVVGCVITGVMNPEQLAMNVKAAEWQLTPEEKSQVDGLAPREGDDSGQAVGARAGRAAPPSR